jgi:predicted nicotinamide N-methyase
MMTPSVGSARAVATLRADLERRFRTTRRVVSLGGKELELLSPANADDLISEDDYVKDERLPYWADLWPSAQILAREVREMRLSGERVIELGCGLGLVAIAAAMAGAQVTATDYYDDAVLFAQLNVAEATGARIEARMVDWTAMPADLGKFDVVLTSDVLYEPRYAALVAGAITATLRRGGEAIVADPGRIACGDFLVECKARGLVVSDATPHAYAEGEIRQTITLYRLRWRSDDA